MLFLIFGGLQKFEKFKKYKYLKYLNFLNYFLNNLIFLNISKYTGTGPGRTQETIYIFKFCKFLEASRNYKNI